MSDTGQIQSRSCDSCTLCCKVLKVEALTKPSGEMCEHCTAGSGCSIYAQRPTECATFRCVFLDNQGLGEEWRPSRANFALVSDDNKFAVRVIVDPDFPNAWLAEPYHSTFRQWTAETVKRGEMLIISVGPSRIVVLPDRDVDLDEPHEDAMILLKTEKTPKGPVYDAKALPPDDPRVQRFRQMQAEQSRN